MYHPTSRVLAVLELLQTRPSITGPELAARLEMDVRTVRRYIMHLQDVGIPVEANIGRYGGYRLRPGFKLPPLMFTEEEAMAVVLGLLASSWLEVGQSPVVIEGALAKVSRVLPQRARERLQAVTTHLILPAQRQESLPDASLLLNLSESIAQCQRVAIDYCSYANEVTQRKVEPYGVLGWKGHWYLVGYCCLRQDYRTFRLDRIQQVQYLTEPFERDENFDCRAYIVEHYGRTSGSFDIKIEFQVPLSMVRQKIPASYGSLTATTRGGTLLSTQYDDLDNMARYLMILNLPFVVHEPAVLREALLRLSEEIAQRATAEIPAAHS
ncbi:MAG TPA: YafY family protein [Ktedonobacteraceae bacterium]|jgi:predicted DNA-binding transcriptional regulator YafY|nr:YafY family protein [Ktedonobacteraceae bacterium]